MALLGSLRTPTTGSMFPCTHPNRRGIIKYFRSTDEYIRQNTLRRSCASSATAPGVALDRQRLARSTSPIHGLVPPASMQSCARGARMSLYSTLFRPARSTPFPPPPTEEPGKDCGAHDQHGGIIEQTEDDDAQYQYHQDRKSHSFVVRRRLSATGTAGFLFWHE